MATARTSFALMLIVAFIAGCDGAEDASLDVYGFVDASFDSRPADIASDRPAPDDFIQDLSPDEDTRDQGSKSDDSDDLAPNDPGKEDPGTVDPGITDPGPGDLGTADPGTVDPGTVDPCKPIVPVPFTCKSGTVVAGLNQNWSVAGKKRSFYAKFPTNPGTKPLAIVFVYHGLGDNIDNFRKFFGPDPDADPKFPFVLIYPQSLKLLPTGTDKGIEWDIIQSTPGDNNIDARLFEEILGCLGNTVTVDTNNLFVLGFSAGAIFSNLLHSRYPDLLPTVFSMSGAWFNDAETKKAVNTLGMATLNWEALTPTTGTVFMTHGGATDMYKEIGITIVDFEKSAQFAKPFLTGNGRTVIDCPHTRGHTNHPNINNAMMMSFFKDHGCGVPSAYLSDGLPNEFQAICTVIAPQ